LTPGRLGDGGADGRAARQEDDLLRVVVEKVVHDGGTSSGIALKKNCKIKKNIFLSDFR